MKARLYIALPMHQVYIIRAFYAFTHLLPTAMIRDRCWQFSNEETDSKDTAYQRLGAREPDIRAHTLNYQATLSIEAVRENK